MLKIISRGLFLTLAGQILVILSLLTNVVAAEPVVTDVRIGQNAGITRFVVELDENVSFSHFVLANPYRVVIDLEEVEWAIGKSGVAEGKGLVARYRYGLFRPGTSRLVLDLNQPVSVENLFLLEPRDNFGYRLVLALGDSNRSRFMEAVREGASRHPVSQPTSSASTSRRTSYDKPVIIIDPGHGGIDPGTLSIEGNSEKQIVLDMAREIKRQLEAGGQYEVILTRTRDIFIPLGQRVVIAREAEADLFISIHADSIANSRVRGATVYTLSETASDSEAAALARKENRSDLIAGVDLEGESDEVASILIDLAQRETMNLSARFASLLVSELTGRVEVRNNSHRFAGFMVLRAPDVPSILVEIGYLSNRQDARVLSSRAGRRAISMAIREATDSYFAVLRANAN